MSKIAVPLKVKRLEPDAKMPVYGTDGAACFDLHAYMDKGEENFSLEPHSTCAFHTGLCFEVPPGYSVDIRSRSGNFFKSGILAFPGTIDSDYRGELLVMLTNTTDNPFIVKKGDRIAQGLLNWAPTARIEEATELSDTVRGVGGFGSTGK